MQAGLGFQSGCVSLQNDAVAGKGGEDTTFACTGVQSDVHVPFCGTVGILICKGNVPRMMSRMTQAMTQFDFKFVDRSQNSYHVKAHTVRGQ